VLHAQCWSQYPNIICFLLWAQGYFYQNSTTCNPRDFQSAYSAFTVARNTTVEDDMEYNAFVHYFKGSLATWLPITAVW
jgi:hypothetical protein